MRTSALAALLGLSIAAAGAAPLDLNGLWQFRFEEGRALEEVADPAFAATDAIAVPGCYDTLPKWLLRRGTGLYRRTFTLDRAVSNVWLVVDGMGLRGAFWIDGRSLGVHPYPYARLELETGPLAAGEHTLFAALDNRFDWETTKLARPYYDFYLYGGFYHGVSLAFDNRALRVRTRDYRTGAVEVEAVNFGEADFPATLVFDGTNAVAAAFAGGRAAVRVPGFRLWSPDAPNLHTVALRRPGAADVTARFGIRAIEARDRTLYLNGEELFLRGVNRHESHPELGAATPEALMVQDIQLLKSLGGNFVRGAHYPQAARFLDLCDESGVLVWEESLGWGNGQDYTDTTKRQTELHDPAFVAAQVRQTRAMVRASFNHPCVVICGFLNEVGGYTPAAKELVDALIAAVRAEDSGRLVTFACNRWRNDLCNDNTDLIAFNTYPGTIPCLPGLPEDLAAKVRDSAAAGGFNAIARHFRDKYPDKTIIVSESGCGGVYGLHDPAAGWMSEEFQDEYLADILETVYENPDIAGYAVWQFCDTRTYHRNSRDQPAKQMAGFSVAGVFDAHRRPKRSAETVRRFFTSGRRPGRAEEGK